MYWLLLVVFLIPLFYLFAYVGSEKEAHSRKLERIQQRLAEKKAESRNREPDQPE